MVTALASSAWIAHGDKSGLIGVWWQPGRWYRALQADSIMIQAETGPVAWVTDRHLGPMPALERQAVCIMHVVGRPGEWVRGWASVGSWLRV